MFKTLFITTLLMTHNLIINPSIVYDTDTCKSVNTLHIKTNTPCIFPHSLRFGKSNDDYMVILPLVIPNTYVQLFCHGKSCYADKTPILMAKDNDYLNLLMINNKPNIFTLYKQV